MNEIVQKSMELGFISREKENIILISTACDLKAGEGSENKDVQNKIGQLFDDVNKAVSDLKNSGITTRILNLTLEERESSKEENISMGRYAVYLKAKEQNVNLTIDEIKDADLLELIAKVGIDNENVPEDIVTEDKDNLDAINTGPAESAVPEVTETLPATSTPGRTEGNTATGSVDSTPALSKNETPGKTETPGRTFNTPAKSSLGQSSTPKPVSPVQTATATKGIGTLTPRNSPTPVIPSTGIQWIDQANERINEIRKRNVQIKVVDSSNKPIENAYVEAVLTNHAFGFGTAITRRAMYDSNYTKFIKDHFNWAVFENESKWYTNEPSMGIITYDDADYLYEFCRSNGIKVRGHCIFWEAEEWQPAWVRSLDPFTLRFAVDNRLNSAVGHFKGKFEHWDVNNEMIHGNFFKSRLGESIWPYMFNRAREIDPNAKYFVNNNITTLKEADDCVALVNWLRSQGVRVDGVGVHGHFGDSVDRNLLKGILDKLSVLNLPIWITEYDSVTPDEYRRADNLENLYRTAFSHPSVEGIVMWGFWERVHWRGRDASIVNDNWTLNEAGRRFESLMNEWTTRAYGSTDGSGSFGFRGFYGTYRITVTVPGKGKYNYTLNLNRGSGTLQTTYRIP